MTAPVTITVPGRKGRRRLCHAIACLSACAAISATRAQEASTSEVESLQQEVHELRARLERLEALLEQTTSTTSTRPAAPATDAAAERSAVQGPDMAAAEPGSERASPEPDEPPTPDLRVGGALRFNGTLREFSRESNGRRGESGLDVFRLNVDGELSDLLISAEYRFYPYMDTLHHGWIGYRFEDDSELQFGVHQVPFGLLPYASHNAWYGIPYYAGFADNYDMGLRYERRDGPWTSHLAFYKNEELNDAANLDRYAFDLVRVDAQQNEEINRINARQAYTFGMDSGCESQLGVSLQRSQLYNLRSDQRGDHWAAAAHLDHRCGRWNIQLQGSRYDFDPANPEGVADDSVLVGAFAGSHGLTSTGTIGVANIAYNFESPWPSIDLITCYNDYSRLWKRREGSTDSQLNTTGCAVGSGPLFAYFDYILANNVPYFPDGSLSDGGRDTWHGRFNINIGYYW